MKTLRYCVALSATTLVLAGCGADAEPKFEADPSPAAPTSATLTPDEPEPWEEKSDEGAIAFVEHWIAGFNQMQSTGETAAFRSLGTKDCEACDNFVDITRSIYGNGSTVDSRGWSVRGADIPPGQKGSDRDVSVVIDQAAEVITDSNGKIDRNSAGRITVIATVTWTPAGWRMSGVEFPA